MDREGLASLSCREVLILRHLVRGATIRLIAYDLDISEAMIAASLKTIYRKLGVHDRPQAVDWACKNGFALEPSR
jgi:DNA-binding NarL/FixJ family response regulator